MRGDLSCVLRIGGVGGTCVSQVNSCTGAIVQLSAASLSDTCRRTWDAFLSGFAHVNFLYCLFKKKINLKKNNNNAAFAI